MAFTKCIYLKTSQGACFTNGNIITAWKTNFGMPYLPWTTGDLNKKEGYINARYGESTSFNLSSLRPGVEVTLTDVVWFYCVTEGDCYSGSGNVYFNYYCAGGGLYAGLAYPLCINICSSPGTGQYQVAIALRVVGIYSDEIGNGTVCHRACATCTAGDDISFPLTCNDITITNYPSMVYLPDKGNLWVEGNDLRWSDGFCYEQIRTGACQGSGGTAGAIWIDTNHYLNWVNSGGCIFKAPWRICQFAGSFGVPPANPSPGAGYAGALWQNCNPGIEGDTHLSYIGCDGNKYLMGSGNRPDVAP